MNIEGNIKIIKTEEYSIRFNMRTGMEIMMGTKGNPDPWVLEHPNMMDIGVVGHCNNKCPWCYQGDERLPHMKLNDYKKLIWNAKDYVNQVALGGAGDPDSHPDFYEILAYTRQCGIVPNYTSSGLTMTPEIVEMSKMTGATAISFYDQPHTYKALKMLMDAGIKTNIHWILSTTTLPDILRLLRDKEDVFNGQIDLERLNAIVLLRFKPCGRGADHPEWVVPDEGIKEFAAAMRNHKGPFKLGLDSCLVGSIERVVGLNKQERMMTDVCEAARCSVYCRPDLKLIPCSFGKTIVDGIDLHTHTVFEAWHSPLFNKFRNKLKAKPYSCPWLDWK